jgi:hypothetical protein
MARESLLQGVELAILLETFYCLYLTTIRLNTEDQTGSNGEAI